MADRAAAHHEPDAPWWPWLLEVPLSSAEHRLASADAVRLGITIPEVLRRAFHASIGQGWPPAGTVVTAYLRKRGWWADGCLWHPPDGHKRGAVAVLDDFGEDAVSAWGAVKRIADREGRTLAEVTMDIVMTDVPEEEG